MQSSNIRSSLSFDGPDLAQTLSQLLQSSMTTMASSSMSSSFDAPKVTNLQAVNEQETKDLPFDSEIDKLQQSTSLVLTQAIKMPDFQPRHENERIMMEYSKLQAGLHSITAGSLSNMSKTLTNTVQHMEKLTNVTTALAVEVCQQRKQIQVLDQKIHGLDQNVNTIQETIRHGVKIVDARVKTGIRKSEAESKYVYENLKLKIDDSLPLRLGLASILHFATTTTGQLPVCHPIVFFRCSEYENTLLFAWSIKAMDTLRAVPEMLETPFSDLVYNNTRKVAALIRDALIKAFESPALVSVPMKLRMASYFPFKYNKSVPQSVFVGFADHLMDALRYEMELEQKQPVLKLSYWDDLQGLSSYFTPADDEEVPPTRKRRKANDDEAAPTSDQHLLVKYFCRQKKNMKVVKFDVAKMVSWSPNDVDQIYEPQDKFITSAIKARDVCRRFQYAMPWTQELLEDPDQIAGFSQIRQILHPEDESQHWHSPQHLLHGVPVPTHLPCGVVRSFPTMMARLLQRHKNVAVPDSWRQTILQSIDVEAVRAAAVDDDEDDIKPLRQVKTKKRRGRKPKKHAIVEAEDPDTDEGDQKADDDDDDDDDEKHVKPTKKTRSTRSNKSKNNKRKRATRDEDNDDDDMNAMSQAQGQSLHSVPVAGEHFEELMNESPPHGIVDDDDDDDADDDDQ